MLCCACIVYVQYVFSGDAYVSGHVCLYYIRTFLIVGMVSGNLESNHCPLSTGITLAALTGDHLGLCSNPPQQLHSVEC